MDVMASKSGEELTPHKNAYVHFSRRRRDEVTAAHPSWSVQQVSSELGRQWKALSPSERKPWVELAQFDKARFHTEAHHYISQQQKNEQPIRLPTKVKKQPNEPRQPDTAYICFWKSRRPEVIAADPTLTAQLVSREVGRQWRALSDSDRQVWVDLAAEDKLRFQEEIARFHPTLEATPDIPSLLKNPLKDPFAPKPAKTGFQLFMSHNRASFALLNMTLNEFRTEMSLLWSRLSAADKDEWYALAKLDERRYETEMNAYKPPAYMDSAVQQTHKRMDELRRLARGNAAAPRLPMNAYNVYLSTERQEMVTRCPDLKNTEIMREIGIAWKALSDDDRAEYQRKAEEDVERFRTEMEAYLAREKEDPPASSQPTKRSQRKRKERVLEAEKEDVVVVRKKVKTPKVAKARVAAKAPVATEAPVAKAPKVAKAPVAGRKKRKSAPPRRPKTAYNLMYMSKRSELLATYQMSHNECSALCGRMWRQMSEDEREPYKLMAAEDRRRYETELEVYNAQVEKTTEAMSAGFLCFLEDTRRTNEKISDDEAAAIWQDMSETDKLGWTELAHDKH